MFGFDAAATLVWLDPYDGRARGAGLLCAHHADTITPLRGWTLVDRRVRAPRLWAERPRVVSPTRSASRARHSRHARHEPAASEAAATASGADVVAEPLPFGDRAPAEVPTPAATLQVSAVDRPGPAAAASRSALDDLLDARSPMLARAFEAARSRVPGVSG